MVLPSMTADLDRFKNRFSHLLERFEPSEVMTLFENLQPKAVTSGQILTVCGQYSDSFYFIWEGRLDLSLMTEQEEHSIGDLGPGQFFGIATVIDPGPALLTAIVKEPSNLLCLTHTQLTLLRKNHPTVGSKLLRNFSLSLANWLRSYEEYMIRRRQPDNIVDFFRIGRLEALT